MNDLTPYAFYAIDATNTVPDGIVTEVHCTTCLEEKPDGVALHDWTRTKVGFHADGQTLQVRCLRHGWNIAVMTPLALPTH